MSVVVNYREGTLQTLYKAPTEVEVFAIDWTEWLEGETVSSASWAITADDEQSPALTEDSSEVNADETTIGGNTYAVGKLTLVQLSSGTAGITYTVRCTAQNSDGVRVGVRAFKVEVRQR